MPRELVESTDVAYDDHPFGLQVSWGRQDHGAHVQVASVTHRQISMWWQIFGAVTPEVVPATGGLDHGAVRSERLAKLGAIVRGVVEANAAVDNGTTGRSALPDADVGRDLLNALDVAYGPCDGLYVSLDRGRVNRVIKMLRKARDAAYGRDE